MRRRSVGAALALAASSVAFPLAARDNALNCSALYDTLPKLLSNLTIYNASALDGRPFAS